jgi:hypothetical protein
MVVSVKQVISMLKVHLSFPLSFFSLNLFVQRMLIWLTSVGSEVRIDKIKATALTKALERPTIFHGLLSSYPPKSEKTYACTPLP